MSVPPSRTSPAVGSTSRRIERPVVDLPHPDSPTSDSVSPPMTVKLTSSTAWTWATVRRRMPPLTAKRVDRLRTSSSGLGSATTMGRVAVLPSALRIRRIGSGAGLPVISPKRGTAASSARV